MPDTDPLHDLLAPLRSADDAAIPPAADIRRRGDRRRRRHQGVLAAGVAAAVAAVAIPLVVDARGADARTDGTPVATDPTGSATPTPSPTTMLDYLDIGADLRGAVLRGTSFDPGPDACGADVLPGAPQDVSTARIDQSEGARRRAVISYESDGGATAVFDALRTELATCDDTDVVEQDPTSLVYVTGSRRFDTGAATVVRAVLIGSYLLVDSADILGAGSGEVVDRTATLLRDQATNVESDLRLQGDQPNLTDLEVPAGIGPVGLGMGVEALRNLDGVRLAPATADGCRSFEVPDPDGGTVIGVADPEQVDSLDLAERPTPEGIGIGSTLADVRDAYPGTTIGAGARSVQVRPGPELDRGYLLALANGEVTDIRLVRIGGSCAF